MDYDETTFGDDPRLRFHFARVDKLPKVVKNLIISLIEAVIIFVDSSGQILKQGRTFSISGDNKGLMCPFKQVTCDVGRCEKCETYHNWRLGQAKE